MVMAIAEREVRTRYPELGRFIHAARRRAGYTQEELAARVGVSQGQLARVERGERRPKVDKLPRWARQLGVSLTELQRAYGLHRDDAEPPPPQTERDRVWQSLSPRVQEALLRLVDGVAELVTPGMLEHVPNEPAQGDTDDEDDDEAP